MVEAEKSPRCLPGFEGITSNDRGAMTCRRRRVRLVYIVSQPVRWPAFEWIAASLDRNSFDLSFLLLTNKRFSPLAPHLEAQGVTAVHLPYGGRHALLAPMLAIKRYCQAHTVDVVHTHFMDACLAGLLGASLAGVRVRVHTRHHAGPYPWSHRRPWGAWYDRWNNTLSTAIVAPSEQARRSLLDHDKVTQSKVILIHHGFDFAAFHPDEAGASAMRRKYGLDNDRPIIGVVARYERIKGLDHVIAAFQRLLADYPKARLVLANARGQHAGPVRRLLRTLPEGRFTEIPFEEQMPALYKTFDVFVHVPIRPHLEAFGQVYVEAMAAGVPCVCTIAGVAGEFVVDGENAIVVPSEDSDRLHRALARILGDLDFSRRLAARARRDVEQRFEIQRMLHSLEDLYTRLHASAGNRANEGEQGD
jgi:glycosyltransferase involved in cell wall biosynthesis